MAGKNRKIRRVAIYARLSVTKEESVSIERQLSSATKYAEARGWEVVLTGVDDGVSASRVRPDLRPGWRSILESSVQYDAVVIWKVDRLARRVLDFLNADAALQERGAAVVAVEDSVDMTSAQGRAYTTILAVFAEMEAAAIGARVAASRPTLLKEGRRAGVRPPYGWMHVPNPNGPGKVIAHDPERIGHVITAADMILRGESINAAARYLSEEATPRRERKNRTSNHWAHARVEDLLRNPTLAGMTPYNPGRQPGERATGVLRGDDGLPVVFEDVAIMSTDDFRLLQARLDERKIPGGRPRVGKVQSLLSGLLVCSGCSKHLHRRGTSYGCQNKDCEGKVSIGRDAAEEFVSSRFLTMYGRLPVVEVVEVAPKASPRVGDIEEALEEALSALGASEEDEEEENLARVRALKARLREAKAEVPTPAAPELVEVATGQTFGELWKEQPTPNDRRVLLSLGLGPITVLPASGRGRYAASAEERLVIEPRQQSEESLLRDYAE